jgi:uncharacterized OB-fold protein
MKHTPVSLWRKQKKREHAYGETGKIISFTIIRSAPKSFAQQAPYPVVLVEDKQKKRMIGQLVDFTEKDIKIGRVVVSVVRRLPVEKDTDVIPYGIKFKPV